MTNAQPFEHAKALTDIVSAFILDLRSQSPNVCVSAPYVADAIVSSFPHSGIYSGAERAAAYVGVAQVAREILRKRHDDTYTAKSIAQHDLELPEATLLNEAYSVMRNNEPVYVPRTTMTREDMEYVCQKFYQLSEIYAIKARALRADWERRNNTAA